MYANIVSTHPIFSEKQTDIKHFFYLCYVYSNTYSSILLLYALKTDKTSERYSQNDD